MNIFKSKSFEIYFALFPISNVVHASCNLVFQCFLGSALSEKMRGFITEYDTSHITYRNTEMKILHFKINSCLNHESLAFVTSWIKESTISRSSEKYVASKNKFLQRNFLMLVIFPPLRMIISIFGFKASVTCWYCIKIPL